MSKTLTLSVVVVSFILGLGTGFILSPEYANKMDVKKNAMVELGRADRFVDLRYIDGVIAHHQNAIFMAKQAVVNSKRQEVQKLATDIIQADEKSISELYQWKKDWYNNTREVVDFEKINLGNYDENFDLRFLNALIAHHDEAIETAGEIRTKSGRNEILNLADTIIQSLTASKETLLDWRSSWYK
jgi:uncharacterized protein (DUF305 family)